METTITVIVALVFATGVSLCFVGILMAALTALGNKRYAAGICIFLFYPFALIYVWQCKKEAEYPFKLLVSGTAILVALFIAIVIYIKLIGNHG